MVTRKNYTAIAIKAAHSVLLELMHLLGEYQDKIVLIGGWVPEFLIQKQDKPYIGSLDVDIALDHKRLHDKGYQTIQELLLKRGYEQGKQPYIYYRKLTIDNQEVKVQVDLLAGEYKGTGKTRRHQKIQDIHARKVHGCDIAFNDPIEITIEGELPDGGKDSVKVRVASLISFLVMKGIALDERLKEKDAWDIYFCLLNYTKGLDILVDEFKSHINNNLVKEGLSKIKKQFASESHIGPKFVVDFEEIIDIDERKRIQRDAYERVNYIMEKLKIK